MVALLRHFLHTSPQLSMSSTLSSPKILPETSPGNLTSGSIVFSACAAFSRSLVLSRRGLPAPLRGLVSRLLPGEDPRVGEGLREVPGVVVRESAGVCERGVRTAITSSSESDSESDARLGDCDCSEARVSASCRSVSGGIARMRGEGPGGVARGREMKAGARAVLARSRKAHVAQVV